MSSERTAAAVTYRMELQYDGTHLHGWAKQDALSTVEGLLDQAFTTVLGFSPPLQVAGRTDAGVHARRQVVSLQLPSGLESGRLLVALNALTPASISVIRLKRAGAGFDARKDALSRTYRYHVMTGKAVSPFWKPYSWWLPAPLAVRPMRAAATLVVGRHDFTAFTPTETEHVFFHRLVTRCAWRANREGMLALEIEAEAFLRHMVRVLVGTMVEVGQGKRTVDEFHQLLKGAAREEAGQTAPARGLFLWDIKY
ncbi:MAG: tRNA pseudouridine(38-40) synthase TruA [Actinobacteria bacterium]|nr:tRNA pseudouridine(38-40) synthase TruA [Actinomycetota bacterium]